MERGGLWEVVCREDLGVDPVAYPGAARLARITYVHLLLSLEAQGVVGKREVTGGGGGSVDEGDASVDAFDDDAFLPE